MKKIYIFLREHFMYIMQHPRLISTIPYRFTEELLLYTRYIFNKFVQSPKNSKLIQQLEELRTDMEKAPFVYKPSLVWEDLYNQFERVLYVEDIKNFKTQRYNRRFSAYAPTNPRFYKIFLWVYWQNIRKRDTLKLLTTLSEPRLGNPEIYKINKTKMSYDLLQSIDEFYSIYPNINRKVKPQIIAELGAGYGRLGYIFLKAIPKSTYIVIDLPGSLVIAQYYLSRMFPPHEVLTYNESKNIRKIGRTLLTKFRGSMFGTLATAQHC